MLEGDGIACCCKSFQAELCDGHSEAQRVRNSTKTQSPQCCEVVGYPGRSELALKSLDLSHMSFFPQIIATTRSLNEEKIVGGSSVMIMELCEAGSLYSTLDKPENSFGLSENEFLLVLRDISEQLVPLRNRALLFSSSTYSRRS